MWIGFSSILGTIYVHSNRLASFPGPAQLSFAFSTVKQATESWAGPGNEASNLQEFANLQKYNCKTDLSKRAGNS